MNSPDKQSRELFAAHQYTQLIQFSQCVCVLVRMTQGNILLARAFLPLQGLCLNEIILHSVAEYSMHINQSRNA